MKKMLLLAGILVVGATSFAGGDWPGWGWPGGSKPQRPAWEDTTSGETELQVRAEVVKKLKVSTSPVDFGRVAPGTKLDAPKENGRIEIDGEAGHMVKVAVLSDEQEVKNGEALYLKKNGGHGNETTVEYTLKLGNGQNKYYLRNGKEEIPVGGSLNVASGAESGNYSTNLIVKVSYDTFAK